VKRKTIKPINVGSFLITFFFSFTILTIVNIDITCTCVTIEQKYKRDTFKKKNMSYRYLHLGQILYFLLSIQSRFLSLSQKSINQRILQVIRDLFARKMDVGHIQWIVKSEICVEGKSRLIIFHLFSNRFYTCNSGVGVETW